MALVTQEEIFSHLVNAHGTALKIGAASECPRLISEACFEDLLGVGFGACKLVGALPGPARDLAAWRTSMPRVLHG